MNTPTNTIQFCINNTIPCFTFEMDETKRCNIRWSELKPETFKDVMGRFLNPQHNGFAILTGYKYIVVDVDEKHQPPQEIHNTLLRCSEAVEKTPGGYHFWFLADQRNAHFKSDTDVYWNNREIKGLDIRAKGGLCYTAPSWYMTAGGEKKCYKWFKGNLSTAAAMPSEVLERLHYDKTEDDEVFSFTITATKDVEEVSDEDEILTVLNSLKQERVDSYAEWINVGMALKGAGYSVETWDEWSRSSAKYRAGECHKKWRTFEDKEGGLGKGSLYHWLKQDNYEVFIQLQGGRKEIHDKMLVCTNASIAEVFHELNPTKYMFSLVNGWYCLQPNGTWLATGSKEILSIPDILNCIRTECYEVLNEILNKYNRQKERDQGTYKLIGDAMKKLSNTSFVKGATAFLQGLYYRKDVEGRINANRNIFAFTNCVMDMTTQEVRPISPEDYITVTCGYDYREPKLEEKEMVRGFLTKIFPRADVLEYVLKALSTTLVGYNRAEFFHVFTGLGANGKSALMDLCKVVFGDYYQTLSVTYLTKEDDRKKDKPLPELANAQHVRMLVCSEPEERDRFQVALLKLITGGDEIACRGLYSQVVNKYVPQFKLWILANDIPKLSKYDQGIERRMRCVHFPTRFVASPRAENECLRDEGLKERILKEEGWRYGLLGLLLDTYKGSERLDMPEEVQRFTDGYLLENNPVGAWLKKFYERTESRADVIQKTEFYQSFLADTGIVRTQKAFSEDMVKCNVGEKKGSNGIRYYFGLVRKLDIENDE